MTPERTPGGKWVIYDASTGQRLERWPIDARGMLASGAFTAAIPEPGETPAAPVTAAPPAPPMTVDTMGLVHGDHPTGAPVVLARAPDASPSAPVAIPTGRRSRKG